MAKAQGRSDKAWFLTQIVTAVWWCNPWYVVCVQQTHKLTWTMSCIINKCPRTQNVINQPANHSYMETCIKTVHKYIWKSFFFFFFFLIQKLLKSWSLRIFVEILLIHYKIRNLILLLLRCQCYTKGSNLLHNFPASSGTHWIIVNVVQILTFLLLITFL